MMVYLLVVWIHGFGAPLVMDAYPTREQCQAVAMVQSAKQGRMGMCTSIRVIGFGEETE